MSKKNEKEVKEAVKELTLTKKEREGLNEDEIRNLLVNKAILEEAKKYKFTDEEKEEFDYFFTNEKCKYFIAKSIEDRISINENDITKIYTENKASFDAQNIPFSQARERIQRDLLNQQVAVLEGDEISKLVDEMADSVEITKKEIIFSKGNSEVIKTIIISKVISEEMNKGDFLEKNKEDIETIENNVYINFYLDLQIRKTVTVTQEEIVEIYEKEKGKLGNITPNDAYQQIGNGLINNKAINERNNLINKIAEDYKVEELTKKYAEEK